jgi:hypothetical protein
MLTLEAHGHVVTLIKGFCLAKARPNRHDVLTILGKQRGFPDGFTDLRPNSNHAPAIRHQARGGLQIAAFLFRDGYKKCGAGPFQNQILPPNSRFIPGV